MPAKPLVIGHRGAAGHAPENTLAAFRTGLRLGADGVECDVHLSADGEVLVLHDMELQRTTDGHGRVGDFRAQDVRAHDAGSWYGPEFKGERVPTLTEVCALIHEAEQESGRPLSLFVELKHGDDVYPGIEKQLIAVLAASGLGERVTVIGFDHRAIARLKDMQPTLRTGVLFDARPLDVVPLAQGARADWIAPAAKWVDDAMVRQARAAGLGVFVWTANDPATMRRLIDLGVDAVGSDYPDRLLAMREAPSSSRS